MNNFLMSSDEDDNFGQEEIPFAQRVAQKMQLAGKTVNLKKSLSSAFSVNEDDSPSTPPSKTARREPLIEVTPPPEWSPPPAIARTNSGLSDLPDTEELLDPENSLKTSSISRSSSAGSLKVKKMSKEEKELEKRMSAKLSSHRSSPSKGGRNASPIDGRSMSPINAEGNAQRKMVTPPPVTTNPSAADRVKANSSNFPQAPARREVIPRSKGVTDTVGEARKKKIE